MWLVRQPRQAVNDPDVLEIPAGKLDEEGESPLETGKRELAEEIGKGAAHWESLGSFWTSVGVLDEEVHLYLATGLFDQHAESHEDERIEIVTLAARPPRGAAGHGQGLQDAHRAAGAPPPPRLGRHSGDSPHSGA